MREYAVFTSESVSEGHPDKMADQISDAILDAILKEDPYARVACETLVKTGAVVLAGEITTTANVDFEAIVRQTVNGIGYHHSDLGFDGSTCAVINMIGKQSPEIAQGVDRQKPEDQGAGDQGLMFGYASDETEALMPLPITLAHRLAEQLSAVRKSGQMGYLRPDGKTQVTIEYDGDQAVRLDTVVVSSQHAPDVDLEKQLTPEVKKFVIDPIVAKFDIDTKDFKVLVNPTGKFVIGGPMGDAGLTGRKIIVDTYGGMARHGGGAFSGKDPSKVDRSAAYAMRWVAKNVVAAGLAKRCEVQVAYAIGKAHPVGVFVETFGTATAPEENIRQAILKVFDLRPAAIIRDLELLNTSVVKYRPTAAYGHFGRPGFTWERTDRAADLQNAV